MDSRNFLRALLSPRVFGGAIVLALMLSCVTLFVLWVSRPAPQAPAPVTAVFNVIPAPTATLVLPTPTPVAAAQATPTVPPSAGGNFKVGDLVQVSGTGGDGVRLRLTPGLSGEVKFLGLESEVFQVSDGPQQSDGYTWWLLVAPYDASIRGWAVGNYLVPAQAQP